MVLLVFDRVLENWIRMSFWLWLVMVSVQWFFVERCRIGVWFFGLRCESIGGGLGVGVWICGWVGLVVCIFVVVIGDGFRMFDFVVSLICFLCCIDVQKISVKMIEIGKVWVVFLRQVCQDGLGLCYEQMMSIVVRLMIGYVRSEFMNMCGKGVVISWLR